MKKIIFILGLAAVVLGTSCSDVLDLNPADRFSPATVWSTTTTADKYVIGLYSIFGANTEMRGGDAYASPRLSDAYSDILKSTSWNQYNHNFNATLLQETAFNSNSAGAFECWSSHYDRIRRETNSCATRPNSAANSVRTGSRFVSPKCVSAVPTPISCCAGFTAG